MKTVQSSYQHVVKTGNVLTAHILGHCLMTDAVLNIIDLLQHKWNHHEAELKWLNIIAADPLPHDSAAPAQADDGPEEPERVWAREPQPSVRNTTEPQRPADALVR